jgi:hypothetical protein
MQSGKLFGGGIIAENQADISLGCLALIKRDNLATVALRHWRGAGHPPRLLVMGFDSPLYSGTFPGPPTGLRNIIQPVVFKKIVTCWDGAALMPLEVDPIILEKARTAVNVNKHEAAGAACGCPSAMPIRDAFSTF